MVVVFSVVASVAVLVDSVVVVVVVVLVVSVDGVVVDVEELSRADMMNGPQYHCISKE